MSTSKQIPNTVTPEFLDYMGHEIRTPLNAVIGLSNILTMQKALAPKQVEIVETLNSSAHTLMGLINGLMDILKIENKSLTLENSAFTIDQLIGEVIQASNAKAAQKSLVIEYTPCPLGEHEVQGDTARIKQVLINLVDNAIKFTSQGSVKIRLSETEHDESDQSWAHISVIDTGMGIAENKQKILFDKLTATEFNAEHGGSGLGLCISKALAELMGGRISLDSSTGKGSCFTLHLPFVVEAVQAEPVTPSAPNAEKLVLAVDNESAKPVVLLVEDYAPNVMVAELILNHNGFNVEVASDGEEALEKISARRNHYCAVLMDVLMPGLNGFEVTTLVRKDEQEKQLPRLPIIAVTANSLLGDREKCIAAGMDEFISKPFEPEYLFALINRLSHNCVKAA